MRKLIAILLLLLGGSVSAQIASFSKVTTPDIYIPAGTSATALHLKNIGGHLFWGTQRIDTSLVSEAELFWDHSTNKTKLKTISDTTEIGGYLRMKSSYPTILSDNNYLYFGNTTFPHTVQIWGAGSYNQTTISSGVFGQYLSGSARNYFSPNGLNYIASEGAGTFAVGSYGGTGHKFYVNGTSKFNGTVAIGSATLDSTLTVTGGGHFTGGLKVDKTISALGDALINGITVGQGGSSNENSWNTAIGKNALGSTLPEGGSNVAVGAYSLFENTNGNNNVAVGLSSLGYNKTGSFNTAIGQSTMQSDTSGSYNTAIGRMALLNLTNGDYNTAIGVGSGNRIYTGAHNIAIGREALDHSHSSSYNIAIGEFAGFTYDLPSRIYIGTGDSSSVPIYGNMLTKKYWINGHLNIKNTLTLSGLSSAKKAKILYIDPSTYVVSMGDSSSYGGSTYTATSPVQVSSSVISIKPDTLSSWYDKQNKGSTAFGWGNHAGAGYQLTSNLLTTTSNSTTKYPSWSGIKGYADSAFIPFSELSAFATWPGAGIPLSTGLDWGTSITNNSNNWNTAYSWGNHASAGYLTGLSAGSYSISVTGSSGSCTGNAATATKLAATKTINGVAFDGSGNITVPSDITPSTSGNVLTSNGSVWTSAAPSGGSTYTATSPVQVSSSVISIKPDTLSSWYDKQNKGSTAFGWGNHSGLYPPNARTISTTSPLQGGGDLSANRTISIDTTKVVLFNDTLPAGKIATKKQISDIEAELGGFALAADLTSKLSKSDSAINKGYAPYYGTTQALAGKAATSHNHSWSSLTSGVPTTVSGYGISDVFVKSDTGSNKKLAAYYTTMAAIGLRSLPSDTGANKKFAAYYDMTVKLAGKQTAGSYLTSLSGAWLYADTSANKKLAAYYTTMAAISLKANIASPTFTTQITTPKLIVTQPTISGGAGVNIATITGGAQSTVDASSEVTDLSFNLARTIQHNTGALANQRSVIITTPTLTFVGASTCADADGLVVQGPPTGGTNATITEACAIVAETKALTNVTTGIAIKGTAPTGAATNWAGYFSGNVNVTGTISGALTGNVTGNVTGSSGSCTGNAATSTKLAATKTINGVAFDGSGNITIPSDIASGASGNVLTSNGSVWTSAAPTGGGGSSTHSIDSVWHTPAGIAYASASSFSFTSGTDAIANMVKWSLVRAVTSNGATLKVGYISAATNSAGTVTCTYVGSADLASGDLIKIAVNQKVSSYERFVTVPGEAIADTGSQGMYYLNTRDSLFLLPVGFASRKAAAGAGASTTFNIRANYSNLYSSAPDLATNRTLEAQRPTTFLIAPGKEVDLIIAASAGATNKASGVQARLILVPTSLFR